jgi:hypothetical protein
MAWSIPDLSDITQVVIGLVQAGINASSLSVGNIKVYASSPDTGRKADGYCHLTLYLLHVGRDPYWRNTPVSGPRPQLNSAQPLSLNLSYLLTSWCDTDFTSEQRAMSIALQAIHSQPIVTQTVIQNDGLSQWLPKGEFTISIEADTIDEMSRLWQGFMVPIRLSALIRVGVVFMAPTAPMPQPKLPPTVANLAVSPVAGASPAAPLLFAATGQNFPPVQATADPAQVTATNGPPIAVGGSSLSIAGNGLDLPAAAAVFLSVPGTATEWQVTAWRQSTSQPSRLDLVLPAAYADPASGAPPPPAATPLPGIYTLTVGSVAPASRSNGIPLAVAPRVDNVAMPPVLPPNAAGIYSIAGAGFVPATTIVALGALPLAKTGAPTPAAGQFTVNAAGSAISFMLPSPKPPSGDYPVLVQANGIAAEPGWIVTVS